MISGPRFVLNPIRVFEGSFGGATLYMNPHYISPNQVSSRNLMSKLRKIAIFFLAIKHVFWMFKRTSL